MYYVIVNNSTLEKYIADTTAWSAKGVVFTGSYVDHVSDPFIDVPGGWGCMRFVYPVPANKLFYPPDVEYRYSPEQDAWLADGELTPYSGVVAGLHTYFVSLEGMTE